MTTSANDIDVPSLTRTIDAIRADASLAPVGFAVSSRWQGQTRSVATATHCTLGGVVHQRHFDEAADEPTELLGTDTAANPQELLLAALNACLTVGLLAHAAAMGIRIDQLEIRAQGQLDLRGFLGIDPGVNPGYDEVHDQVHDQVHLRSNAPAEQLQALHAHVMKTSPNFANFVRAIKLVPQRVVESV